MCEVIFNPALLIATVVIYSIIVVWVNKRFICKVRVTDKKVLKEAIDSPNVDREIWQSDKNEEILKNVFVSVIKKPITQWQGLQLGLVIYYAVALVVAILFLYLLLYKC
ncbi:MAG: hypothetical protein GY931_03665 [Maribacter sp.]|nr:hypothetical protein [Maribacter sp.]